ncbi:hypothetical protein [Helicobacter sp.]|nr:hypothetical protein [Helicobacter sp.]MBD5165763.1 hypothetical protein [Helicobacter sp.]
MLESCFDLTQPVGLVETWVSISAVCFMMWLGFVAVKHIKEKRTNK